MANVETPMNTPIGTIPTYTSSTSSAASASLANVDTPMSTVFGSGASATANAKNEGPEPVAAPVASPMGKTFGK